MEWVLAGVVLLLAILVILQFNSFVRRRNRVDNAWAQIDVQLQRRYDLIPNLIETVEGYVEHEKDVLDSVTQARSKAISAQGVTQQAEAESAITSALRSLFAVAEAYPQLQANENFLSLQDELSRTESRIAYARQVYNDAVQAYNTEIQTVPGNLLAAPFGFRERDYFEADDVSRGPVSVQF